jgi:hypothetical protein
VSAQVTPASGAVLAGGRDGRRTPPVPDASPREHRAPGRLAVASIVAHEPAAEGPCGRQLARTAAGSWQRFPDWAAPQLQAAVVVASSAARGAGLASRLHQHWFTSPLDGCPKRAGLPHDRRGLLAADGWWRTWGRTGAPYRPRTVCLVLSPRPERLAVLVREIIALLDTSDRSDRSWALSCATAPSRIVRSGSVVLDLPAGSALPAALFAGLGPLLEPVVPPLCLPVARGVGLASRPRGMSFGAHRCRLVALGLRRDDAHDDPARAIAATFAAHGVDPCAPHRGTA